MNCPFCHENVASTALAGHVLEQHPRRAELIVGDWLYGKYQRAVGE